MTKVFQTTFGTKGNCFSACLASLFEEPIENWESCANHYPNWREELANQLATRGLQHVEISVSKEHAKTDTDLQRKGFALNDKHLYIVGVTSRNKLPHAIIGRYNETLSLETKCLQFDIEHDPLGDIAESIMSVDCIVFLAAKHV